MIILDFPFVFWDDLKKYRKNFKEVQRENREGAFPRQMVPLDYLNEVMARGGEEEFPADPNQEESNRLQRPFQRAVGRASTRIRTKKFYRREWGNQQILVKKRNNKFNNYKLKLNGQVQVQAGYDGKRKDDSLLELMFRRFNFLPYCLFSLLLRFSNQTPFLCRNFSKFLEYKL